ncbi:RrF2 family transcriptional regulator [Kosmotoga olearia]|uniref:Transcriptional regulator, BadM/Rrf2 family n=1 Tax=Kosmotoga olearia (strain ATCC BAA-1733 / DSM 21960 / TBF 19.5.1) TaxID=521045 RepID=C5CE72_KOSOT|nr:Rrf2 family transcriptional regulator [Kosmotoga olearia]ACR79180.1 transcriptional regulator, BadM/Rrf2 family [Kosmotoga olearia TBF 19.5.1]
MLIQKTVRYALRILVKLSIENRALNSKEISLSENLDHGFTLKILYYLKKAGLVRAIRGRKGGYALAKNPEDITITKIFEAIPDVEERLIDCDTSCKFHKECYVKDFWELTNHIIGYTFSNVSIANIINNNFKEKIKFLEGEFHQ